MKLLHILAICFVVLAVNAKNIDGWWNQSTAEHLNSNNFEKQVWKEKHYLVEFYSKRCYWCEKMSPVLSRLADYYKGPNADRHDVGIGMVDAPENKYLDYKFDIRSYPTVMLMIAGDVNRAIQYKGEKSFELLKEFIETHAGPEKIQEEVVIVPPKPIPVYEEITVDPEIEDYTDPANLDDDDEPQEGFGQDETTAQIDVDSYTAQQTIPKMEHFKKEKLTEKLLVEPTPRSEAPVPQAPSLNTTAIATCTNETLYEMTELYSFALTQETANQDEISQMKEKFGNLITISPASNSIRDTVFFFVGLILGLGFYYSYYKISEMMTLYHD